MDTLTLKLTLIDVEGSLGVVFPDDFLAQHGWHEGDTLQLDELADGWTLILLKTGEDQRADHNAQTR
jgi:hypothetical protein